jgi:hypothetical protein
MPHTYSSTNALLIDQHGLMSLNKMGDRKERTGPPGGRKGY